MATKVLVIGFDGMEPSAIRQEMSAGRMPVLDKLYRQSKVFTARNLPGFGQGVFWPSMATTVNPGAHGRFFRRVLDREHYTIRDFVEDRDMRAPPFWQRLDQRSLRTATIDILECPLADIQHGIQVADWLTHAATGMPRSTPDPALARKLIEKYGSDPIPNGSDSFIQHGGTTSQLAGLLQRRVQLKTQCALDLLSSDAWDLFFVTFSEPHDIGHMAWGDYEKAVASGATHDPVRQVYRELDLSLERLVATCDPATVICLLAGTGMRRHVLAYDVLTPVLRILDLGPAKTLGCAEPNEHILEWQFPPAPITVPRRIRRKFLKLLHGVDMERASRRFFSVPHNDNAGAIRFNVIGRDRCGQVEQGAQLEALISDVSDALREIRNVKTGRPLIDEVIRVGKHIHGAASDEFPDLLVSWDLSGDGTVIHSPRIGRIECTGRALRTGDHSRDALFLASRPGIVPREMPDFISPMDVGATVEGLFGPLPAGLDGRALLEPIGQ